MQHCRRSRRAARALACSARFAPGMGSAPLHIVQLMATCQGSGATSGRADARGLCRQGLACSHGGGQAPRPGSSVAHLRKRLAALLLRHRTHAVQQHLQRRAGCRQKQKPQVQQAQEICVPSWRSAKPGHIRKQRKQGPWHAAHAAVPGPRCWLSAAASQQAGQLVRNACKKGIVQAQRAAPERSGSGSL